MSEGNTKTYFGLLGCSAFLHLVISIVAISYGSANVEEMCSDSFIHLGVWMIVQGIVMLVMACGAGPLTCLGFQKVYIALASLYGLFELIWIIMGGVILWRDSQSCKTMDPIFYQASMAVVIISISVQLLLFSCKHPCV